ncbi:MAG: hypothetical protein AVDCRST_MAG56-4582 [uncultured Cytophagales bacterium]|uniref:Uncharacterized protein n=1 Tax=uncultured Cytophagales bacterium TaxID=158755 RepID=A0A6J4JYN0_9SPHI|nr:MAG: hypothetical protein AVDCRST_MAG56-4582 [uncultured Cytophagales bacterium]
MVEKEVTRSGKGLKRLQKEKLYYAGRTDALVLAGTIKRFKAAFATVS